VTNNGEAQCNNTTPAITLIGSGVTAVSTPGISNIPGGGSTVFQWTYSAEATGTVNFSCYASGTDANSGLAVNAAAAPSQALNIQTPANLISGVTAPDSVSINQVFTVKLQVTNIGGATAVGVAPNFNDPVINGTGTAVMLTGPVPVNGSLTSFQNIEFIWTYSATATGNVTFSNYASATDSNSGLPVSSASTNKASVIQTRPSLAASMAMWPSTASVGQTMTVTMTVTNSGQAAARAVSPTALVKSGTGNAGLSGGPVSSPSPWDISGGSSRTYTWTYLATSAGTFQLTGRAAGTDGNDSSAVQSSEASSQSVTIQAPAALISQVSLSQSQVSTGNYLTVYLAVTNTGGASANNITPSMFESGAG
ncbi:MAG TPA: hypothetical protein P5511_10030, partial [Candidatus Goldiibacteriota bacterium]|nr:hypothetical protein [Candidatus Goldiibacteriota bacterium]